MTPEEKKHIVKIHSHLGMACGGMGEDRFDRVDEAELIEATTLILADPRFHRLLKNREGVPFKAESVADLYAICQDYLRMLLFARDNVAAATLIWGPDTFTSEPSSVRRIWDAMHKYRLINILGASSSGKTYSASAYFLLQWILDPEWTTVRVMSTKEEHLKKNLFGDMQRLYFNSVIPLPGKTDTESIATELGKKIGMGIFILTIAGGPNAPAAIKGAKVKPRPHHPLFGTTSRSFLLIDEAQEVPINVFDEVPNLFASFEEGDVEHIKVAMSANPKDEFSRYGQNCRPVGGWEGIQTRDSDVEEWTSETGWHCVRLNALKSENIVQGKTIFPRFFTMEGFRTKLRQYGGDPDHPLMWAEVYGMFPPQGHLTAIIQKHHVDKSYGEWIFDSATVTMASVDVAFVGDLPIIGTGRVGHAVGWMDFNGVRHDLPEPKYALQVDTIGILPRGDTQDLADEIMKRLKILNVKPANFSIDRTGVGQGVHDNICRQWNVKICGTDLRSDFAKEPVDIMGMHYGEKATEVRICEEDTKTPLELYQGLCSELWYATARFFEYDCIRIGRGVDLKTSEELVNRRGGPQSGRSKLLRVESKEEYKMRGFLSPDRADAFTQMVQNARLSVPELKPKAPDTILENPAAHPFFKEDAFTIKFGEPVTFGEYADWIANQGKQIDTETD